MRRILVVNSGSLLDFHVFDVCQDTLFRPGFDGDIETWEKI
jgi:hypothetical protein